MSQTKYKLSTMFGEDSPVTTALLCVLTVSWLQAATLTQMLGDLRRRSIVQAGRSVAPAQVCTVLCCTVLYCAVLYCTVAPAQVASYSFQNAFFYLQWPDSASAVASLGPALPALTKTRRRHKLHPPKQRSKYICLPAEVKEVRRQQLAGLGQWHWPVLLCCLIFISHKLFMFRLETILFGNFTEEKH